MTALPKRKISTRRQGKRRASHQVKLPTLVECRHCHQLKKPHQICPNCGYYRQKEVFSPKNNK